MLPGDPRFFEVGSQRHAALKPGESATGNLQDFLDGGGMHWVALCGSKCPDKFFDSFGQPQMKS